MGKETFYITTPIYYYSDTLHIGHAYTSIAADAVARYKKLRGYDVKFLTGADEHGQKIENVANLRGMTTKEHLDEIDVWVKNLWKTLKIEYNGFIRTTDDYHKKTVQKIFKTLYDKGDIYKSVYEGLYCVPCESFYTESQLVDGKCPDCGRDVNPLKEESYFFKLSKYTDRLIKHIEENPEFIQPVSRRNEMINNFLKPGLTDLCVSRTSFKWGIPVDFDEGHVVYVWIDALSNYITALGYLQENDEEFKKYWPADMHIVGKDILRFHTIIWPALLMAQDLPLPKQVFAHGFFTIDGRKISKSFGNVIDPSLLVERYGIDAIRYFILREFTFGSDGDFRNESLIKRINADLANDLGNLLSRTVGMIEKYFGGEVTEIQKETAFDKEQIELINNTVKEVEEAFDNLKFSNALISIWNLISNTNRYADKTEPWVLVKDESRRDELARVMYVMSETLRVVSVLIAPVLVDSPLKIQEQLNIPKDLCTWEKIQEFGALNKNIKVNKGEIIFPRLDVEKELEETLKIIAESQGKSLVNSIKQEPKEEKTVALIGIEDFTKLQIQVGEIIKAEKVPKADKLLVTQVKFGDEVKQILSGIAMHYTPEDLVGKKALYCTNLKPVKIRGLESNGMILCAKDGENLVICTVEPEKAHLIGSGAYVG
ncbi:MAG: methionine--tRNA ligase [Lachnospirales bacterium]